MHEFPILLPKMASGDNLKLLARAQELAGEDRFRGQITTVTLLENRLIVTAQSRIFEHDEQEKNELERVRDRAARFFKELGVFRFGEHTATSRNLWEVHWRPQIEYLMNNAIIDNVANNHVAALMLMIPCIDRTFTFIDPQESNEYTTAMLKWAFPEEDVGISAKDYKKCIKEMRDGLVNGLKHDSFLRGKVVISNTDSNPLPFYVNQGPVVVNPSGFWTHVRNKIDGYYADKPRNISIGS